MLWAEQFYFNVPDNIRIDAINVHDYMVNGGTQEKFDEISHPTENIPINIV